MDNQTTDRVVYDEAQEASDSWGGWKLEDGVLKLEEPMDRLPKTGISLERAVRLAEKETSLGTKAQHEELVRKAAMMERKAAKTGGELRSTEDGATLTFTTFKKGKEWENLWVLIAPVYGERDLFFATTKRVKPVEGDE